ncbi:MAG TPA: hypothetical protein HA272_11605 [Methanoregula sp.]|nr:hypothetical protein [Methanoregula sp.]
MKAQRLIFNPYLIVAVLFILAVSIAPAMAADANSRYMNSFSAGSAGQGSSFSKAGGEKHPFTQKNTAGISAGSPATNLKAASGADAPVKKVDTPRNQLPWWAWLLIAILIVLVAAATAGVLAAAAGAPVGMAGMAGGIAGALGAG